MCSDQGFGCVMFEGDCLTVVNAVSQDFPCWNQYGQVIEDIRSKLQEFSYFAVRHVKR
jgi:hypothetical protein